jgi:hypothetical protein
MRDTSFWIVPIRDHAFFEKAQFQRLLCHNFLQVAEFGIFIPRGLAQEIGFAEDITLGEALDLPEIANEVILNLSEQLMSLHERIRW